MKMNKYLDVNPEVAAALAAGKPVVALESTIISLTREVIFGVALPIILPIFFGLDGLLYSFPAADILTFLIAIVIIRQTYGNLRDDSPTETLQG